MIFYDPGPWPFLVLMWLYLSASRGNGPDHATREAAAREFAARWEPRVRCGCLVVISLMALLGLLIIGVVIAAIIAPDTVNGFFDWLEVRWNMPFRINFPF